MDVRGRTAVKAFGERAYVLKLGFHESFSFTECVVLFLFYKETCFLNSDRR